MARILPEFTEFGFESDIEVFPELEDVEASEIVEEYEIPEPYGIDLAFDFVTGDLITTVSGDVKYANEDRSLDQWISTALVTPQGGDYIFSDFFGSRLGNIIGVDYIDTYDVDVMLSEAILQHERLTDVIDIEIQYDEVDVKYYVSFKVIRDDSSEIEVRGIQVA